MPAFTVVPGKVTPTLCDKHGIGVVNFKWQKQLFENGAGAFERKSNSANARRRDDANAILWRLRDRPAGGLVVRVDKHKSLYMNTNSVPRSTQC